MATSKIVLKKSSVVAKTPLATDLDYGELALNYADGKLFYKTASNTISFFTTGTSQGTVTSVSGTGTVSGLTLTGSVTSSGSLTLGGTLAVTPANFASQTANTVLAAPNGAAGTPTFRTLVAADIPTLNQSTTGNAATATTLQTARAINGVSFNGGSDITVPRLKSVDDRAITPADGTTGYATFAFTSWANNNTAPYADALLLRSYTDASGGNDNLVTFRKDAIGMRIWQQTYGSATAFSSYVDVLTSGNYNSYALPLSGGTLTGNLTAPGFIGRQYGAVTGAPDSWIWSVSPDNPTWGIYYNEGTPDAIEFRAADVVKASIFLDTGAATFASTVTAPTFSGALSGNAATATTLQTARNLGVNSFASGGSVSFNGSADAFIPAPQVFSNVTTTFATGISGYGNSMGMVMASDGPGGSAWHRFQQMSYSDSTTNVWQTQLAQSGTGGNMWIRSREGGTLGTTGWGNWYKFLHDGNYNSYSPTLTGAGASGTWGISISGSSASTSGNAATATTLQTARTINGTSFNGSANIKTTEWVHSDRDFASGTLVTTDINYGVTNGDPFVLEIRGNSYGDVVPYDIQYQGYIYSDTIINHGGTSNGTNITGMVAINVGGNLCFWWPRQSYWNGFNVRVYTPYATYAVNRVTSITSTTKPTSTKEVALSANIRQSLHSGNYTSYSPTLTGSGASGTWGISVTGSAGSVAWTNVSGRPTAVSSFTNDSGYITSSSLSSYLPVAGGTVTGDLTVNGTFSSAAKRYASTYDLNTPTTFQVFDTLAPTNAVPAIGATWHSVMNWPAADTGYITQIANAMVGDGTLYARRKNGGVWGSWRTILDSSNIGSFALPLSGGTLTGTLTVGSGVTGEVFTIGSGTSFLKVNNSGGNVAFYGATGVPLILGQNGSTSSGLTIPSSGVATWLGNALLHAGNYTSYSPSLTGSGASGTWGISVTGTAYGLSSSNYINRTGSSGNLNTDFNNTPAGTQRYQGDDSNLTNSPGNTWWIYEHKRHSNGTNYWGTQLAWGWEDNSNRLMQRNVSAGTWSGWVEYLNTGGRTFSGNLTMSGNITAYSDETLKTNWRSLPSDYVYQLSKVKCGIYDRTDIELTQEGVSAQSLQDVLPYSVIKDEDDKLSVNYGSAALISTVELAKKIVEQESRIQSLEALIEQLLNKDK